MAKSAETLQRRHRFEDNAVLQGMVGPLGVNLRALETILDLKLVHSGDTITLTGTAEPVRIAARALDRLYEETRLGQLPDTDDVAAAVRMARQDDPDTPVVTDTALTFESRKRRITPRSPGQAAYMRALTEHELVFALGPAGTGKTYLAVAHAVSLLLSGAVERLVLSRPAVEAGERLGFLPGDLRDKVDPYLRPLYDALHDMLPHDRVQKALETGTIEVAPLAFMRGRTLANAYVILDEAQNTTAMQMKMAVTRLGGGARMVVTGDLSQVDLPSGQMSGLRDALLTLEGVEGVEGVAVHRLTAVDVVRHPLVARIVAAYDSRAASKAEDITP